MKPILVIALGIATLAGGAIGAVVLGLFIAVPAAAPSSATPTLEATEVAYTPVDDSAILELALLHEQVNSLAAEVARLSSERTSAVETTATPAAALVTNAPSRDVILGVMQAEEDRKDEERRLEREQREKDSLDRRVQRIAEKLSLSSADQTTLAQIYTEERAKQSLMWTEMRDGSMDRETIREAMTEVRDWRAEQLTLSFGEDLAGQISEESGGRGFDWGGGRGNTSGGRNSGGRGRGN